MHEGTDQARVAKLGEVPAEALAAAMTEIDGIFFKSSSVQSFAGNEERARFRERWLGRYLTHDPDWAYVARDAEGHVVGYVIGAIDDPAQNPRYADISYFAPWSYLTAEYPAHLHINVAPEWRGGGLGALLIAAFAHDAAAAGAAGLHVVTGEGMRNVGFYLRNGFQQLATLSQKGKGVVFLGRRLR